MSTPDRNKLNYCFPVSLKLALSTVTAVVLAFLFLALNYDIFGVTGDFLMSLETPQFLTHGSSGFDYLDSIPLDEDFLSEDQLREIELKYRFSSVRRQGKGTATIDDEGLEILGVLRIPDHQMADLVKELFEYESTKVKLQYESDYDQLISKWIVEPNITLPIKPYLYNPNWLNGHVSTLPNIFNRKDYFINNPSSKLIQLPSFDFQQYPYYYFDPVKKTSVKINPPNVNYDSPDFQKNYEEVNYSGQDYIIGVDDNKEYRQTNQSLIADNLGLGLEENGQGTYTLQNSELYIHSETDGETLTEIKNFEFIGFEGTGLFNHISGTNVTENLSLGALASGKGTYKLHDGHVYANNVVIGYHGTGDFIQNKEGGSGKLYSENIFIGYEQGSKGKFELYASAYNPSQEYNKNSIDFDVKTHVMAVGYNGFGELVQNGGNISVDYLFSVANNIGSDCSAYTMNDGVLDSLVFVVGDQGKGIATINNGLVNATYSYIGYENKGELNQNGGIFNSSHFYLGYDRGSEGIYNINGGIADIGNLFLGRSVETKGEITQTGGELNVHYMGLGFYNNEGIYTLSAGSAKIINLYVGYMGEGGEVTQTGGELNVSYLRLGSDEDATGIYTLNDGFAKTISAHVGLEGTGEIIQHGGELHAISLFLGFGFESHGTYNISGGTLKSNNFYVGYNNTGIVNITSLNAEIEIANFIVFGANSYLTAVLGAEIRLDSAKFDVLSTSPENLQFENLNLIFNGDDNILEVACKPGEYFDNNFAFNSIEVNGSLILTDLRDNQRDGMNNEVLYVRTLKFGENGSIDLGNITLYYSELIGVAKFFTEDGNLEQIAGHFETGMIPIPTPVPEPSVFALSLFGLIFIKFCKFRKG
ncbi:MAG: hypothetical protein RBU23_11140 [Candidatus Auribacterota bacterium]|jgi:hypothetical protein|nr:hypothetical protein [Candidatus Auribacterota bacterium]